VNVLHYEYAGYEKNEKPTEFGKFMWKQSSINLKDVNQSAEAAYHYLVKDCNISPKDISK